MNVSRETPDFRQVDITEKRMLTADICQFTLTAIDGQSLPDFEPGAHISIETPGGAMRRYSLVNEGSNPEQYVVAVKRETESRGGSSSMHDHAIEGSRLNITEPENTFPLDSADDYMLIAGGIGITPIYAMARKLDRAGKPFKLIYCTRTPEDTAYLNELSETFGANLILHHDEGKPDNLYDFWDHFAEVGRQLVYCCGPVPLMDEIKAISGHWPEGRVNFENFKPVEVVRADDKAFDVVLQKSQQKFTIPPDRSVLEALRDAGIKTSSSCESGTCGSCKCRLIKGDVDHRDLVLTDEEKASHIMICVSRANSGDLVIDL